MREITKKTIKRIKAGYHDDLMEAIEFLIDSYDEDKADAGYRMALEDMAIRSQRLAEVIMARSVNRSSDNPFTLGAITETIEDYFTNALKE